MLARRRTCDLGAGRLRNKWMIVVGVHVRRLSELVPLVM
jgi:hypothetical protein